MPAAEFEIRPGRARRALSSLVTGLAILAVAASGVHWIAAVPVMLGLIGLLARAWFADAPRVLRFTGPRAAAFEQRDSILRGMLGAFFVSPWFIGLAIHGTPRAGMFRRSRSLGIFRDELPGDEYRRLAARLRLAE